MNTGGSESQFPNLLPLPTALEYDNRVKPFQALLAVTLLLGTLSPASCRSGPGSAKAGTYLWSEQQVNAALDRLQNSVLQQLELANPKDTLLFYQGETPMIYWAYYDAAEVAANSGMSWYRRPLCYTFGGYSPVRSATFRNVFIYGDANFLIPEGARTYDILGQVVAEARIDKYMENGKFEIEEVHYGPGPSKTPARQVKSLAFCPANGEVIFRAKSIIQDGTKLSEQVISGHKNKDYYFTWPEGFR